MKNYNNGLATKNKILKTCKKLFYKNGYTETTFSEICRISGANPGSIAYHFTTKHNIASVIYKDMMHKLNVFAAELFPQEDQLQKIMIALGMHIKILFEYPSYRVFSAQFLSEGAYDDDLLEYIDVVPEAYAITWDYIEKEKADFLFAAFLGMDGHIESYIDKHIDELKFEKIARYYFELHYLFLNQNDLKERVDKLLEQIDELEVHADSFEIAVNKKANDK